MRLSKLQKQIIKLIQKNEVTRRELFRALYPDEDRQHHERRRALWTRPPLPAKRIYHDDVKTYQSKQASLTRSLKKLKEKGLIVYDEPKLGRSDTRWQSFIISYHPN